MARRSAEFRYVEWDFSRYLASETRARCIARAADPLASAAARGIYLELLNHCYNGQGTLPADHQALAELVCVPLETFETLWPLFSKKFRVHKKFPEKITNDLVEIRLRAFKTSIKQQKKAGKASSEKKVTQKSNGAMDLSNDRCWNGEPREKTRTDEKRIEEKRKEQTSEKENQNPPPDSPREDLAPLQTALERFAPADLKITRRIMETCVRAGVSTATDAAWMATWSIAKPGKLQGPGLFLNTIPEFARSKLWENLKWFLSAAIPIDQRIERAGRLLSERNLSERESSALHAWWAEQAAGSA